MDSGNSGSIQTSSGGDEEYDSRADSFSSLLSFPSHHHHPTLSPSTSSFDALSPYFDSFSRPPPLPAVSNPILNCTGMGSLVGLAPSLPYASFPAPTGSSQGPYAGNVHTGPLPSSSSASQQHSAAPPHQPSSGAATTAPPRGSKKRPRASRRTPTTVLETDTSNFRAMVQEFTGVPSPPFPSSMFARPRFDLLRVAASAPGRSPALPDLMPGYLLRPLPQKISIPFASGSASASSSPPAVVGVSGSATTTAGAASSIGVDASLVRALAAATASTTATASITSVSASTNTIGSNHHPPSELGLGSRDHNSLTMFNFQPLLPPSPAAKSNSSPNAPNHGMEKSHQVSTAEAAVTAGYGIGDGGGRGYAGGHLGALLPSFTSAEGVSPLRGGGRAGRDDVLRWFEVSDGTEGGDQGQLRPSEQRHRGSSRKLNCTGSASSDYHPEKGPENVPTRGEGMVESWICSSD